MGLRLRALDINIHTQEGLFGTRLRFNDGLVIIRADNTSGKSTCILAIIYALGLEGMLGPSHQAPLTPVLTKCLELDDGAKELDVVESEVFLEIQNSGGQSLTIKRVIKGSNDTRLVTVWNGPMLTEPSREYSINDYFVRIGGAASRESGFHTKLAEFIGWELPLVSRYSGDETVLYMECLFPLLFVEQKHGWSGLQAVMPTYLKIREVGKRAIEFLLGLEAYENQRKRERLEAESRIAQEHWKTLRDECGRLADGINGVVKNISRSPVAEWPPFDEAFIEVPRNDSWVRLISAIGQDREMLKELKSTIVPAAGESTTEAVRELTTKQNELSDQEIRIRELFDELQADRSEVRSVTERLRALDYDLRRNQDAKRLQDFGSLKQTRLSAQQCPTCDQPILDALVAQKAESQVMSLEENINFIKEQQTTFQDFLKSSEHLVDNREKELLSARQKAAQLRSEIRSLKDTLTSGSQEPSSAIIEKRIRLEDTVRSLNLVQSTFDSLVQRFSELSAEWVGIQAGLAKLPKGPLSDSDENKIRQLQTVFVNQLEEYGFSSIPPSSISLSHDTYKPGREGFDLGYEISASDNIRLIWAYLNGVLELSVDQKTNHPGLLMLDEPRQQDTDPISFKGFLRRISNAGKHHHQVVFATSEKLESLEAMLGQRNYQLHHYDGPIMRPIK